MPTACVLQELKSIHNLITFHYPNLSPDSLSSVLGESTLQNNEITKIVHSHLATISKTTKILPLSPQKNTCFLQTVYLFISTYTDEGRFTFNSECLATYRKLSVSTIQEMYKLQKDLTTHTKPITSTLYLSYAHRYNKLFTNFKKLNKTSLYASQMAFTEMLLNALVIEDIDETILNEKEFLLC